MTYEACYEHLVLFFGDTERPIQFMHILLAQQEGLLCTIDVMPTMLGMGEDSSEHLTLVVDPGVAASHLAGAHEPLIMAKLFTLTAVKKWLSLLFLNFFSGMT